MKAVAVLLTALLATQMVGTPAFASLEQSEKAANEQIATDVNDVAADQSAATMSLEEEATEAVEGGETEAAPATETEAAEPAPATEPESATEPAPESATEPADEAPAVTEEEAADPAAEPVSGDESADAAEPEATEPEAAEPAVAEPEEVVADVSMPAFEGYAYVGNMVVKVTAGEGVLPEGTTVSAYQVNRQDVIDAVAGVVESDGQTELKNSVAIDVTLLGPDGNVIQPEGAVNVCFFNTNLGNGEINVYRVADDASTVQEIGARQADAQVQSFDVDHFSIYVVGEEGTPVVATYTFVANDGTVSTQIVKTGDVLVEPEAPEIDGKYFLGWFNGETEFTNFGQELTVDESAELTLTAKYVEAYYAFFENDEGVVIETIKSAEGQTIDVSDVTFPVGANESIVGWELDGETYAGDYIFGASDVTFTPVVQTGAWLTFDSQGGTYIAPQFYNGQENPQQPAEPERVGYEFDGWYTDAECTQQFNFNATLTASDTIYAKWNANHNTQYTILYWIENADDDGYTYVDSRQSSGTTGGSVNLTSYDTSTDRIGRGDRNHFTYNSDKTQAELSNVTIAGDGSTVVNVYFSRNYYTLTFQEYQRVGSGWNARFEWVTVHTIRAKYNSYIADEFTEDPLGTDYAGDQWADTGNTYSYALNTLDRMPGTNVTFHNEGRTTNTRKTIHYYVQTIDSMRTENQGWPNQPGSDFELRKDVTTYL